MTGPPTRDAHLARMRFVMPEGKWLSCTAENLNSVASAAMATTEYVAATAAM